MAKTVAHICILVVDIEKAIETYKTILRTVSPTMVEQKAVRQERWTEHEKYITAFFQAPGDGCDIQLLQPPDEASPLYKRLVKHGEGIHHIAFSSSHLEDTYRYLKDDGVSVGARLYTEHPEKNDSIDVRHFWILPQSAHGVLIELIDEYRVVDGMLTGND